MVKKMDLSLGCLIVSLCTLGLVIYLVVLKKENFTTMSDKEWRALQIYQNYARLNNPDIISKYV